MSRIYFGNVHISSPIVVLFPLEGGGMMQYQTVILGVHLLASTRRSNGMTPRPALCGASVHSVIFFYVKVYTAVDRLIPHMWICTSYILITVLLLKNFFQIRFSRLLFTGRN